MPIRVTCACGKQYTFTSEVTARRVQCQACGAAILVPANASDTQHEPAPQANLGVSNPSGAGQEAVPGGPPSAGGNESSGLGTLALMQAGWCIPTILLFLLAEAEGQIIGIAFSLLIILAVAGICLKLRLAVRPWSIVLAILAIVSLVGRILAIAGGQVTGGMWIGVLLGACLDLAILGVSIRLVLHYRAETAEKLSPRAKLAWTVAILAGVGFGVWLVMPPLSGKALGIRLHPSLGGKERCVVIWALDGGDSRTATPSLLGAKLVLADGRLWGEEPSARGFGQANMSGECYRVFDLPDKTLPVAIQDGRRGRLYVIHWATESEAAQQAHLVHNLEGDRPTESAKPVVQSSAPVAAESRQPAVVPELPPGHPPAGDNPK